MADVWTSGRLTAVLQPAGTDSLGNKRFRRAPFDLLQWSPTESGDPVLYINTLGFEEVSSASVHALLTDDSPAVRHEFGYYTGDQIVIDTHLADGNNDDWHSLHGFGYL